MAENAQNGGVARLRVTGSVSAENAERWLGVIEEAFDPEGGLELDCAEMPMISSAGLRVLLLFQKRLREGRKIRLRDVSPAVMDVLRMTGFAELLEVIPAVRRISLEGCPCFARGGTGECYRLDAETIVKLYYENTPDDLIEREKACARAAFVAGIPTAISYDMVQVGARKGIVYEMIKAKTLAREAAEHPERIAELGARYAALARLIHATPGDPNVFGPWTDEYRSLAPRFDYLSEAGKTNALAFLDSLSGYTTCVHGDFNPNNIMLSDGELLLIDMGEFSIGCPMFDLAALRFTFFYCGDVAEDEVYPFTGLTGGQQRALWEAFIRAYFAVQSYEEALASIPEARLIDELTLLKAMRCLALFPDGFIAAWRERVKREARARFEPNV